VVQLIAERDMLTRSAVTDSLGRFSLSDVPEGRHTIGFLHALLDSLGIEPPQRQIEVTDARPMRVDLGTPSAARLRTLVCGRADGPGRTLVVGFVRGATDRQGRAGMPVTASWMEVVLGGHKPMARKAGVVSKTAPNGWFALCNVPSSGTFALSAGQGTDSSDAVEFQVGADGFLRRDLYVGRSRALQQTIEALAGSSRISRPRAGDGRLTGIIVAAVDGRPLGGAQVGIVDGPRTRANDRGEWTLGEVPLGTRVLEVRAVGYYPTRQPIDIVDGGRAVRVALPTLKAVLDTVRVTAARLADRHNSGFEDRRRTGLGHYLTPEDIERRSPRTMAQVLRLIPGIRIDRSQVDGATVYDSTGSLVRQTDVSDTKILMRASVTDWCYPAVYVNGHYMRDLDADDLDAWVRPNEILGVEVYTGITAPVQFQQGMTGCGSILIWTK
jgi:hypothetical protein